MNCNVDMCRFFNVNKNNWCKEGHDPERCSFRKHYLIGKSDDGSKVPCSAGLYSDADMRESIDCYRRNYDGQKWASLLKDSKDQLHFLGACNAIEWLCAELEKRI